MIYSLISNSATFMSILLVYCLFPVKYVKSGNECTVDRLVGASLYRTFVYTYYTETV
jgi:hypothetical protein